MNKKGFSFIELVIVVAILTIFSAIIATKFIDNRGSTQERAFANANLFVEENNIKVKRIGCSGDSDGDGYGSCSILTMDGEKIFLECPCNYSDVKLFKATTCKEVFSNININ